MEEEGDRWIGTDLGIPPCASEAAGTPSTTAHLVGALPREVAGASAVEAAVPTAAAFSPSAPAGLVETEL